MMKLVVLSCLLAASTASVLSPYYGGFVAPIAYSTPLLQPYNYRGPLSLAPGQPAEVLGADGRPLDTLEVNLDRAAHFTAKTGLHLLKKRSAAVIAAPIALTHSALIASAPIAYSTPLLQPYNYRGPLSLAPGQPAEVLGADGRPLDTLEVNLDRAAHFTAKTGLHLLKKRSAAFLAAPVSRVAVAHSPLITPAISYSAPIVPAISSISYTTTPLIRSW